MGERTTHPREAVAATSAVVLDEARLAALRATGLLDSAPESAFERLTNLATRLIGAPVALVSLVDADRQFFKSSIGLGEPWATARETPLSHSFCQHVVATNAPLVITDARAHLLVCDNLAIPDLGVIAYAGMPLTTAQQETLGSFCVIDTQPRRWSESELAILNDLAAAAMTEIDLRLALHALASEREAHQRLTYHVENSPLAVIECDRELRVLRWSPGAERIFGWSADAVVGRRIDTELALLDDGDMPQVARAIHRLFTGRDERNVFSSRNLTREGRTIYCDWYNSVFRDRDGAVVSILAQAQDLAQAQEVTAQVHLREQLARQALHDALTGLPSRASLTDRFRNLLAHRQRFAVLFLDRDGFKAVNDQFGHAVGDELLVVVARRLQRVVRAQDSVIHLGGDEFVVLMDQVQNEAETAALAGRLAETIERPITLAGQQVRVRASIGIALSSPGCHDPEEVLLAADAAMYSAKQQGTGPRFAARLGDRAAAEGGVGAPGEHTPAPGGAAPLG